MRSFICRTACFLLVAIPGGLSIALELSFNGASYRPSVGEVRLQPGMANHFEILCQPEAETTDNTLLLHWEVSTPAGDVRSGDGELNRDSPRVHVEIGPLCTPPVYEYESGKVYQRGYRLVIEVVDKTGRPVRVWSFYQDHGTVPVEEQQGMGERDPLAQRVRLVAGVKDRIVYNPRFGSSGPLSLRLAPSVLTDQDDLTLCARLNAGDTPEHMTCVLRLSSPSGEVLLERELELRRGEAWVEFPVQVSDWPVGDYEVQLLPRIAGALWNDGPALTYRRRVVGNVLRLSPFAPWVLERDSSREEIQISDFRTASESSGKTNSEVWRWIERGDGAVGVASNGDFTAPPLVIRPKAAGFYAILAVVEGSGCLIQVGANGPIRGVALSPHARDNYVESADLADSEIRIYPSRDPESVITSLRLVPVTEHSARGIVQTLANPPVPMLSINDWAEYFGAPWTRLLPDQFTAIVQGEAELGFRTVGWSVARSWVEYPSKLPNTQIFPCVPYDEARKSSSYPDDPYDYGPRIVMMNQYDPLAGAFGARSQCTATIWPWVAMQRHYSENFYGGMFSGPFYREHPEWRQQSKDGFRSGLSFYYPEVRRERVDILMEVAELGADGLLVGCDRQVPMLQYETAMVKEFQAATGIDPLTIDVNNGPPFERWIRFRSGFFTETLRELKRRLTPLRAERGVPIPVGVRIPSGGLFLNLAQGLDVETWCREGLINLIDLDPLEENPGESDHDVRPYLDLGHRYGIPVYGGIGSTAFRPANAAVLVPGLKRARGLHRAGIDGVDTYETEILAWTDPLRFTVALYGHPEQLEQFLNESNMEAVYPVDAGTAAAGHDNHSVWRPGWTWSLSGFKRRSL